MRKQASEESFITEEQFQIKGVGYKRIYFHSPIKYETILKKYGKRILSIDDFFRIKQAKERSIQNKINTWNLCRNIFSGISKQNCRIDNEKRTFILDKKSKYKIFIGKAPKNKDKRVCLISPNNTLFLDAKPNWKTFGFGIILSLENTKPEKRNIKVSEIKIIPNSGHKSL